MTLSSQNLAVCSWSLQPQTPQQLVERLQAVGLKRVQLHLNPLFEQPQWSDTADLLKQAGIEIVSGMLTMKDEDYSTLETIRETGGIVPDHTWEANWSAITAGAQLAIDLGLSLITFHAGFLPSDTSDPNHEALLTRMRSIESLFAKHNLKLGLETGQETVDELLDFLGLLDERVGANFDPANMILYDKGDPIESLKQALPRVLQIHIKDANRTQTPGEWGQEVAVGEGQVDWPAFMDVLLEAGYEGDLVIEREAGGERAGDVVKARELIAQLTERARA